MIDIKFTPEKNGILLNQENTFDVLLNISSEVENSPKKTERLPLNLSLVIDRSGSMNGEPLEEAKKCASMLVDRMSEKDRLSVVTYESHAEVLVTSQPVSHKSRLKSQIRGITTGGMTALYDGWSLGAEEVAKNSNDNFISRVLLLSDGQANRGLTDDDVIASHCRKMAEAGVTTSTYGLSEHFNENLMAGMASAGQGQAHYGQTAEDLMDPFQEEFDLLEALLARRMRLRMMPEKGVSFEVLNGYSQDKEGRFIMPDLAFGADVWALLRINVNADLCSEKLGSKLKLLSAYVDYLDQDGADQRSDTSKMTIDLCTQEQFAVLEADETVQLRTAEVRAATLQENAQVAARAGNWSEVDKIMVELDALGKDNEWIKVSVERLRSYSEAREQESFSKETLYKSRRMKQRRVAKNELRFSIASETMKPSYLRRKTEQGKREL
ncbi:VWA domain-containing protein [Paracoccaceae bacterium]|nr:VWA domain-containing protein [Paracoccaceae bacterium]